MSTFLGVDMTHTFTTHTHECCLWPLARVHTRSASAMMDVVSCREHDCGQHNATTYLCSTTGMQSNIPCSIHAVYELVYARIRMPCIRSSTVYHYLGFADGTMAVGLACAMQQLHIWLV